jgi:hypothetical protein
MNSVTLRQRACMAAVLAAFSGFDTQATQHRS